MIAVQSKSPSLAGLFYIPQYQGCTGGRYSAKESAQYLSKPDHQPNIRTIRHQQSDFLQQYASAREGFSVITTRGEYFVAAKKKGSTANATLSTTANGYQPFGSIPKRSSSLRPSVLSQLPRLMFSAAAAASNCALSSGVILIWKVGDHPAPFVPLSRLIVDTYVRNSVLFIMTRTYINTCYPEKETPPNGITSTERGLTTTDRQSIEVAVMKNTTHPQGRHSITQNSGVDPVSFVWIIAAVRRDCPTVKATIHHIAAATEHEARRTLAKDHICFFAGRIRQEVANA